MHPPHNACHGVVCRLAWPSLLLPNLSRKQYGGSYYLTYHRWATRANVEAAYPNFTAFLQEKLRHDPAERFTSDWRRHFRMLLADEVSLA